MEATAKIVCDRLHAGMTLECNTQRISKFSPSIFPPEGGEIVGGGCVQEGPFHSDYSVGEDEYYTLSFLYFPACNKDPGNLMFDWHHEDAKSSYEI